MKRSLSSLNSSLQHFFFFLYESADFVFMIFYQLFCRTNAFLALACIHACLVCFIMCLVLQKFLVTLVAFSNGRGLDVKQT